VTDDFMDPGEPGELTGFLKAKDLINKPLIIKPLAVRHDGQGKDDDGNPTSYTYVNCDVWVLDRAGVVEKGEGVRIAWKRVIPQLEDRIGKFVAGTPIVEADNSRVLQAFSEAGKEIARKVIAEIKAEAPPIAEEPPVDEYADEPAF
jgi:hypothetical protein